MRQLAAAVLEVPAAGFKYLSRSVRRSLKMQLALGGIAIALLVSGLLVGLPTSKVDAKGPTPYDPPSPTAVTSDATSDVTVDAPYVLEFTRPMNEGSVADSLTIKPVVPVKLIWDSASETLSITPAPNWAAFTTYSIQVAGSAMDQSGMQLGSPVSASFMTGALTSGKITATIMADNLVAPTSDFQITFNRPVKLATIQARLSISPAITGVITGDDPTDVSSQVFTFTPDDILAGATSYTVSFDSNAATDAAGSALLPVAPLTVQTMVAPGVVRFRPKDKGTTSDPNQVISVRFSVPMDRASTAASLSVVAGGHAVRGSISWAENDTVLVLDPSATLPVGATVYARISATAKSATGQRLSGAVSASFKVLKPTVRRIPWTGGSVATKSSPSRASVTKISPSHAAATKTSPWHAAELYYLALMNCTRTGGWVTRSGNCSSVAHHTMQAQDALVLSAAISNSVSRPYSEAQAERGALTHYLNGTTPHGRLAAAGFGSASWGENLASPPSAGLSGMIDSEIFFQNESHCGSGQCEFAHYYNIMDPYFHHVGIGVWVDHGRVRLTVDFYG
jgi:hypothetical protein